MFCDEAEHFICYACLQSVRNESEKIEARPLSSFFVRTSTKHLLQAARGGKIDVVDQVETPSMWNHIKFFLLFAEWEKLAKIRRGRHNPRLVTTVAMTSSLTTRKTSNLWEKLP